MYVVRRSTFCRRYMPTLRVPVRGSCVITAGSVMNGAGSPGQQRWIGSRSRFTSSPVRTTSCDGPRLTVFGRESAIDFSSLRPRIFSRSPSGGCISSTPPTRAATASSDGASNALHIRLSVPNWLISSAWRVPLTFSNRSAGPPDLTTRSTISVISRSASTSAATRTSSPSRSRRAIHSRRSAGAAICSQSKERTPPGEAWGGRSCAFEASCDYRRHAGSGAAVQAAPLVCRSAGAALELLRLQDDGAAAAELDDAALRVGAEDAVDGRARGARHPGDVLLRERDRPVGVEPGELEQPPAHAAVGVDVVRLDHALVRAPDLVGEDGDEYAVDAGVALEEAREVVAQDRPRLRRLESADGCRPGCAAADERELAEAVAHAVDGDQNRVAGGS